MQGSFSCRDEMILPARSPHLTERGITLAQSAQARETHKFSGSLFSDDPEFMHASFQRGRL